MSLERTDVDLSLMLQHVFELVGGWGQKEKVEIQLKCPKNIGTIMADERRLQQAIINLVRNAIAYTPAGGQIILKGKRKKEGIEITVSDTGIGISNEDRLRIFEPFERAQRGSTRTRMAKSGAGIGLSLVRNIVTLHGGRVELESEPDKGTTVLIFLPFTSQKTDLKLPIGIGK